MATAGSVLTSGEADDMETFLARQVRFNRQTADNWDRARPHREICTDLLVRLAGEAAAEPRRLTLLGAGTCNDIDLTRLPPLYSEITLADFDAESLTSGLARQGQSANRSIRSVIVDVTGCSSELDQLSPAAADVAIAEMAALLDRRVQSVAAQIGAGCDVAVSMCLLSQLIQQVVERLGEQHPGFLPLVQAVRQSHLRLLLNLVRPGGKAVLITDVVSSDTVPQLPRLPREELLPLLAALIPSRNFFSGLNPFIIHQLWTGDPKLQPLVQSVEPLAPWTWLLGQRTYLVCGFVVTRSPVQDVPNRSG